MNIDQEHSAWAREKHIECGSFYIEFPSGKPYPCSCGFVEKDKPWEKLTTDEWENAYNPLDGPSGSLMWEHNELQGIPESRIWSLIDGDSGAIWATPGYHVVNMIGFAVTGTPWKHRNIEARYDHDTDTDTEDTDERSGSA